jgi:ribonuclease HI
MKKNLHGKQQQNLFDTGYAEMYCDGASSGNPGPSGIGVVINFPGEGSVVPGKETSHRISEYIGIATNNVAEYSAFLKGLETARSLGIQDIRIFMDSELLARQINGVYRVKNKNLIPLWIDAINMLKEFSHYSVEHIPREMNKEADSLARRAVARRTGK